MDNRDYKKALDKCWNKFCESQPTLSKQAGVSTFFNFIFEYLYPIEKHNLTSDAEGEDDEMLYVSRKKLQYFYGKLRKVGENHAAFALQSLFGSKCLPDEGTDCTPVEPKFKRGDMVRIVDDLCHEQKYRGEVSEIVYVDKSDSDATYKVDIYDEEFGGGLWYSESDLEPYTEPTDTYTDTCTDDGSSPDHFVLYHEMVDDSINDGFREHNRLHIASMAMAGLLANPTVNDYTSLQDAAHIDFIVEDAVTYADALIAKCGEGDSREA